MLVCRLRFEVHQPGSEKRPEALAEVEKRTRPHTSTRLNTNARHLRLRFTQMARLQESY